MAALAESGRTIARGEGPILAVLQHVDEDQHHPRKRAEVRRRELREQELGERLRRFIVAAAGVPVADDATSRGKLGVIAAPAGHSMDGSPLLDVYVFAIGKAVGIPILL